MHGISASGCVEVIIPNARAMQTMEAEQCAMPNTRRQYEKKGCVLSLALRYHAALWVRGVAGGQNAKWACHEEVGR